MRDDARMPDDGHNIDDCCIIFDIAHAATGYIKLPRSRCFATQMPYYRGEMRALLASTRLGFPTAYVACSAR